MSRVLGFATDWFRSNVHVILQNNVSPISFGPHMQCWSPGGVMFKDSPAARVFLC